MTDHLHSAQPVPDAVDGLVTELLECGGVLSQIISGMVEFSSSYLKWRQPLLCKGMPRISTKNQVTIPVAALEEAGLHAGDRVVIDAPGDGELRIRRGAVAFDSAFGVLTGVYPPGYLERLDAEDKQR
jgi:bifunctional DNA-binding transcriptional regulator/antitoxin component of YhaV-PrlF toxin-antitoxin module